MHLLQVFILTSKTEPKQRYLCAVSFFFFLVTAEGRDNTGSKKLSQMKKLSDDTEYKFKKIFKFKKTQDII